MNLTINQNTLLEGLQKVSGPATTKQNFPVLNAVLIESTKDKLILTTTDLDTTIVTSVPASITKSGKVLVPIKKLISIIRELPPQSISLEIIKNYLLIICEKIEFKVNILNHEEFPKIQISEETPLIKLNPDVLSDALRLTSFCVGYEDTNYVLNGIFFELEENYITNVSTDGKRLAVVKHKLPPEQAEIKTKIEFILPIRVVAELQRLIKEKKEEVFLFTEHNKIGFDLKDTQMIARPIEGEFPQYTQYLPPPQKEQMRIKRTEFLAALRRAALLSVPGYVAVELEVKEKEIVVSKSTPQMGEVKEVLDCVYNGKAFKVGFNPSYLIDVLKNLDEEEVIFEFVDPDKRAVLRTENYIYLVLPMRI